MAEVHPKALSLSQGCNQSIARTVVISRLTWGESASKLTLTHLVVGRTEGLSGSLAVGLGPPSLLCQAGLSIGSSQHGRYKQRRQ